MPTLPFPRMSSSILSRLAVSLDFIFSKCLSKCLNLSSMTVSNLPMSFPNCQSGLGTRSCSPLPCQPVCKTIPPVVNPQPQKKTAKRKRTRRPLFYRPKQTQILPRTLNAIHTIATTASIAISLTNSDRVLYPHSSDPSCQT